MSARAHVTPATVASSWNLDPVGLAWPGNAPGMSAAVFAARDSYALELSSPVGHETHVVSVGLARFDLEVEMDGQLVYSGPVERGQCEITRAGERLSARFTGDWRVLQFYLPATSVMQAAADLGLPLDQVDGVELMRMRFARDPLIARLAGAVDARLRRGGEFLRLELDDIAITLAERLVRRHSTAKLPQRRPPIAPIIIELSAILDEWRSHPNAHLDELAALLAGSSDEAQRALQDMIRRVPRGVYGIKFRGHLN